MAAKKKPQDKKKAKPAKPKSLTEAEKRIAELKKKQAQAKAQIKKLTAERAKIESGVPDWKKKQAEIDKQIADQRKVVESIPKQLTNAQNVKATGLQQYSKLLKDSGFSGAANRLQDRAGGLSARVNNQRSNQYLKAQTESSEEIKEIIEGGIKGLGAATKDAIPTATQLGQGLLGMNLGEVNTALYGGGGQRGLLDMQADAQRRIQETSAEAQRQQLQDIGRNAEITRTALKDLSPEVARATSMFDRAATRTQAMARPTNQMTGQALRQQSQLAGKAMRQAQNYQDPTKGLAKQAITGYQGLAGLQQSAAEDAYARARQLTPEQMREADQSARESFAARGMLGSTGSVASEILNRESSIAARRGEAAGLGQLAQQGQAGLVGLASGYESDRLGRQQQMRGQAMNLSQAALGAQQSVRGEARQGRGDLYDTGQFFTNYGLPLLTQQTSAQQAGLGLLSAGLGMSGQGSGFLEAGANVGMGKYTTDQERIAAFKAADATEKAGWMGLAGNVIGKATELFNPFS